MANQYVKEITSDNFSQIISGTAPVLIDFWAEWCGPCRMIGPTIDEIAEEMNGKAVVGKINIDQQPDLAKKYGVMSIPTLLVLKNGEITEKEVGARAKNAIIAMIEKHI